MTPVNREALLTEVKDLLNQALILMRDVPDAEQEDDSFYGTVQMKVPRLTKEDADKYKGQKGRDGRNVYEGDQIPGTEAETDLSAIKSLLTVLVEDDAAVHMWQQYYTSNC